MIEKNTIRRVQAEALAIVHCHPVGVKLRHCIGRSRVERCCLRLKRFLGQSVHFGRGRLIEARSRTDEPHSFQYIDCTEPGYAASQERLLPGSLDKGLRSEIVDLSRLDFLTHAN